MKKNLIYLLLLILIIFGAVAYFGYKNTNIQDLTIKTKQKTEIKKEQIVDKKESVMVDYDAQKFISQLNADQEHYSFYRDIISEWAGDKASHDHDCVEYEIWDNEFKECILNCATDAQCQALEDYDAYLNKDFTPQDCAPYEKYDAEEKSCYPIEECDNKEECQKLEMQVIKYTKNRLKYACQSIGKFDEEKKVCDFDCKTDKDCLKAQSDFDKKYYFYKAGQ